MRSQIRCRVAQRANAISHSAGLITELTRRHRSDFLPVLKNSVASRSRLEFRRSRATGRPEARALVSRVEDLVYPAAYLTGIWSAFCSRVHLFGAGVRINREVPGCGCSRSTRVWKSERVVLGNEDRISGLTCRHRLSVVHPASQLPGSRQQFVISLRGGRLRGRSAQRIGRAASGGHCHRTNCQDGCCFDHACLWEIAAYEVK